MGGKKSKPAQQPPASNKNNNNKHPKSNKAIEYKLLIVGDAGKSDKNLRLIL